MKTDAKTLRNDVSGLPAFRLCSIAKVAAAVPKHLEKRYLLSLLGRGGRKNAMAAMCALCCGWERAEVVRCTSYACPLWAFRSSPPDASSRAGGPDVQG